MSIENIMRFLKEVEELVDSQIKRRSLEEKNEFCVQKDEEMSCADLNRKTALVAYSIE